MDIDISKSSKGTVLGRLLSFASTKIRVSFMEVLFSSLGNVVSVLKLVMMLLKFNPSGLTP